MGNKFKVLLLGALLTLVGCSSVALMTTPEKQPVASNSKLSQQAEQKFWTTLHQGRYEDIPKVEYLLTAAYLENPNDPSLAAHLGFLHIWQIAERQRLEKLDPRIVDHIVLARKYFSDAVELAPDDARFLGFYGDSMLAEGKIFHDQRQQVKGYFILKDAINAWPEFNYFTAGYVMTILPAKDEHFKEAVEWQWKTLNLCASETVDRANPDFSPYMKLETQTGQQRACWNSWIAPYNFEGFFLNMGDMLVKQGDWQTAIKLYNNAKLAKNYQQWKYRDVLEERIAHAKENVVAFNQPFEISKPIKNPTMMFNSSYSCMACHRQ